MTMLTACVEHARLVERLRSDKDEEMHSRLQRLEQQTANRIELLRQQHSDALNALNAGNSALAVLLIIIRQQGVVGDAHTHPHRMPVFQTQQYCSCACKLQKWSRSQ